jgi:hypothetical protein
MPKVKPGHVYTGYGFQKHADWVDALEVCYKDDKFLTHCLANQGHDFKLSKKRTFLSRPQQMICVKCGLRKIVQMNHLRGNAEKIL